MLDCNAQCLEKRTSGPGGVYRSEGKPVEDHYFALPLDSFKMMNCAHLTNYNYPIDGAVISFVEFYCSLLIDSGMYD